MLIAVVLVAVFVTTLALFVAAALLSVHGARHRYVAFIGGRGRGGQGAQPIQARHDSDEAETASRDRGMIGGRCDRCGWSFNSIRLSGEGSCPRCRLRDGIQAPLQQAGTDPPPGFLDLIAAAGEGSGRGSPNSPRRARRPQRSRRMPHTNRSKTGSSRRT